MKELYQTAKEKGSKTCFSMQGQTSPVTEVIKKVLDEGKIGKVLSSTWVGCAAHIGGTDPVPVGNKYFSMRETGGNIMTIFFLHSMTAPSACCSSFNEMQSANTLSQRSTTYSPPSVSYTHLTLPTKRIV